MITHKQWCTHAQSDTHIHTDMHTRKIGDTHTDTHTRLTQNWCHTYPRTQKKKKAEVSSIIYHCKRHAYIGMGTRNVLSQNSSGLKNPSILANIEKTAEFLRTTWCKKNILLMIEMASKATTSNRHLKNLVLNLILEYGVPNISKGFIIKYETRKGWSGG